METMLSILGPKNGAIRKRSLFDNFFNDFSVDKFYRDSQNSPKINISSDEKEHLIELFQPGSKKENFKVDIADGNIIISADAENKTEENGRNYSFKEYQRSSFSKSFTLPENVDSEKINAKYEDGVLKVSIPKLNIETKKETKSISIN